MSDCIRIANLRDAFVQENGIIRNGDGYLIGRLVDDIDFDGEHIQGCVEAAKSPIKDLVPALLTDAGYRYGWQANIAMAFVDEVQNARKNKSYLSRADIHKIANDAADNFLTLLCSNKSEDRNDQKAND